MKGVRRFDIKGKLAPRYVGLDPILDKYQSLAYRVELPSCLAGIHNVFRVSQYKKYLKPLTDVVVEDTILLEPDLTYKAYLIKILEQQDRVTPRGRLLDSIKSNGTIIRKRKQLGNMRTISELITQYFYSRGNPDSFHPFISATRISGRDFF
jgi:hypothetical protein